MDNITIRRASGNDIPTIHQLIQSAFAHHRDKLDPPFGAFRETEEKLHLLLLTEHAAVAVSAGQRVGCVFYNVSADSVYLHRLAVLPNFRHYGMAGD